MAFQTRPRDPLLETHVQDMLRRRGRELTGVALIAASVLFGMMLYSYSPDDPSWISATSEPAKNLLGNYGAWIAGMLILTIGWASWSLPVLMAVWGLRFVFHKGENRLFSRIIFAPVMIAALAVFLSTHIPPDFWPHGSGLGLGGVGGDGALIFLVDLNPLGPELAFRLTSAVLGVACLFLGMVTLGLDRPELRRILRFTWLSFLLVYGNIVSITLYILRLSVATVVGGFRFVFNRGAAHRDALAKRRTAAAEAVRLKEQEERTAVIEIEPVVEAPPRKKLFAKMMKFDKPDREQEPPASSIPAHRRADRPEPEFGSNEERVNARISAAVSRRRDSGQVRVEPSLGEPSADTGRVPKLGGVSRVADFAKDLAGRRATNEELIEEPELPVEEPPLSVPRATLGEQKSVVQHPVKKPVQPSTQAKKEAQPSLFTENRSDDYQIPALNLLSNPAKIVRTQLSDEALEENARMLENVLDDYGVKGQIVSVRPGPVVTMYELEPAPGLKASRVIGLADDIARSMSALSARVSTIPGRSIIGIELPNDTRETVLLREILSSRDYGDGGQSLPLALGKDIGGASQVANLAKMPHLLIAGTTGSGKSVAINTMILSLLYKLSPEECRLIMIDPKMLELSVYDGIPHLLSPVVTDPKKAVVALKWVVGEMEERYRKMSKMGVRNIGGYNGRVQDALDKGEDFTRTVQTGFDDETGDPVFETETFKPEKLPYIVVIVDEMADLMMVAGKEIEACIQRLAQMARASGIHLIMATQRPSVDVITGTIKANFPTRISFQVTSKIDSRTILGEMGAEQLLGMGDMLFMEGGGRITRIHAPFVSDEEVEEVVNHLKAYGPPVYVGSVVEGPPDDKEADINMVLGLGGNTDGEDALYDQAVAVVLRDRKCSTSYIQRKLSVGYNKAAKLVEEMEDQGVVSAANHVGKREILVPEQ
jgi:S-DNA-T family DNA segregation ATPase FtsK/SpoIIIE